MLDNETTQNTAVDQDSTEEQESGIDFTSFGFRQKIMRGIMEAGYREPSPIQKEAIPIVMEGHDVIAQAQTGTGKTAAFALPVMNNLKMNGDVEVLVITPTRELAMQVSDEMFNLGRFAGVRTLAVYGGQPIIKQVRIVERGVQAIVATPGRLLDHLSKNRLKRFNPSVVILDESDEMLDMGFLDDIEEIFTYLPPERQTLLFSATMPPQIRDLAKRILNNPVNVKVTTTETTNKNIEQRYYLIEEHDRVSAIGRLLDAESPDKSIIFTRMKREADELGNRLFEMGYQAGSLHGDMEQRERQRVIADFKSGRVEVLVATDVAARGLDIRGVTHVFNYHIPLDPESYVHRIGRTGRAGKSGMAITLVNPLEYKELRRIKEISGASIELYRFPIPEESREERDDKILKEVLAHNISDHALKVYERLKENIDIAELTLKLLSKQLVETGATDTSGLGVHESVAKRFERQLSGKDDKPEGGDSRRRSSRSRGGGNSRRRPPSNKKRY